MKVHEASGDLTVVGCQHGNEVFGKTVIDDILSRPELAEAVATIFANEAAYEAGKQFTDTDLNRSYKKSDIEGNEALIADELLPIAQRTPYLLDIHTSIGDVTFLPIIVHDTPDVRFVLSHLPEEVVALIQSPEAPHSLIGNHNGGVSLEFNRSFAARDETALTLVRGAVEGILTGELGDYRSKKIYRISELIPLPGEKDGVITEPLPKGIENGEYSEAHGGYVLMPRAETYQGFLAETVEEVVIKEGE